MERVIITLTLDVYDHDLSEVSMKAIACDNTARRIKVRFLKSGATFDIENDAVVFLSVIRPDGVGVSVRASTIPYTDGGTVYGAEVGLSNAALEVKGTAYGQFVIRTGVDEVLRSEIFKIEVGRALDQETEEWADNYQGYNLEEIMQKLEVALCSIKTDGTTIAITTQTDSGTKYYLYVDEKIDELRQEASTAVSVTVSDAVYITTGGGA